MAGQPAVLIAAENTRLPGAGARYVVCGPNAVAVRRGIDVLAAVTGTRAPGEVLEVLEARADSSARYHVRCTAGWVAILSKDGRPQLQRLSGGQSAAASPIWAVRWRL